MLNKEQTNEDRRAEWKPADVGCNNCGPNTLAYASNILNVGGHQAIKVFETDIHVAFNITSTKWLAVYQDVLPAILLENFVWKLYLEFFSYWQ